MTKKALENLKPEQIMYLANDKQCKINKIVDEEICVQVDSEIEVITDNQNKKHIQIKSDEQKFSVNDIGTKLFLNKGDCLLKLRDFESNPAYQPFLQHSHIRENIIKKEKDKMKDIKKYEPNNPMSEWDKADIIESYSNKEQQRCEEKNFLKDNTNGDYIGRLDVDTYFHDYSDFFTGHYYTRVYVSESPSGTIRFLDRNSVVWQLHAGIWQEQQGSSIGNGVFAMQTVRNHYLDSGIVVDWRSPIAELYYDPDKTPLKLGEKFTYEHGLLLKRRFINQDKDFDDVFVAGNKLFEAGSVDPFLLQVLKENKDKHQFTDIIRSIQLNQNTIIRQTKDKNLVVQGCAGSGKTVIMLHRLSFLVYNNPLDLSSIKILTPNELFNLQISDLSKKLALQKIPRLTVEDYYLELLKRYNTDPLPGDELAAEKSLDQSLVNFIYSNDFIEVMEKQYKQWQEHLWTSIDKEKLESLNNKYQIRSSSFAANTFEDITYYLHILVRQSHPFRKMGATAPVKMSHRSVCRATRNAGSSAPIVTSG